MPDQGEKTEPDQNGGSSRGSRLAKALVALLGAMATAVPVIGAFEHWFDSGSGPSGPTLSSEAEYGAVCNLSNARQRQLERDLVAFKRSFEHARDVTGARDAMLLLTRQDIAVTSELDGRAAALTPSPALSATQKALERDWKENLGLLDGYREKLSIGVSSAVGLERIAASLPKSAIEARGADARSRLLRLGGPLCVLDQKHERSPADWSPPLRRAIADAHVHTGSKGSKLLASTHSQKANAAALPAAESSEALPEPETKEAAPAPETEASHEPETNLGGEAPTVVEPPTSKSTPAATSPSVQTQASKLSTESTPSG